MDLNFRDITSSIDFSYKPELPTFDPDYHFNDFQVLGEALFNDSNYSFTAIGATEALKGFRKIQGDDESNPTITGREANELYGLQLSDKDAWTGVKADDTLKSYVAIQMAERQERLHEWERRKEIYWESDQKLSLFSSMGLVTLFDLVALYKTIGVLPFAGPALKGAVAKYTATIGKLASPIARVAGTTAAVGTVNAVEEAALYWYNKNQGTGYDPSFAFAAGFAFPAVLSGAAQLFKARGAKYKGDAEGGVRKVTDEEKVIGETKSDIRERQLDELIDNNRAQEKISDYDINTETIKISDKDRALVARRLAIKDFAVSRLVRYQKTANFLFHTVSAYTKKLGRFGKGEHYKVLNSLLGKIKKTTQKLEDGNLSLQSLNKLRDQLEGYRVDAESLMDQKIKKFNLNRADTKDFEFTLKKHLKQGRDLNSVTGLELIARANPLFKKTMILLARQGRSLGKTGLLKYTTEFLSSRNFHDNITELIHVYEQAGLGGRARALKKYKISSDFDEIPIYRQDILSELNDLEALEEALKVKANKPLRRATHEQFNSLPDSGQRVPRLEKIQTDLEESIKDVNPNTPTNKLAQQAEELGLPLYKQFAEVLDSNVCTLGGKKPKGDE